MIIEPRKILSFAVHTDIETSVGIDTNISIFPQTVLWGLPRGLFSPPFDEVIFMIFFLFGANSPAFLSVYFSLFA